MPADPMAALVEALAREEAAKECRLRLTEARLGLRFRRDAAGAFLSGIALRRPFLPDAEGRLTRTWCTDGASLWYSPEWTASLPVEQLMGVIAHEAFHIAQRHPARGVGLPGEAWNIAVDLATNGQLRAAGFALPDEGVFPGEGPFRDLPAGESAEWYYDHLPPGGEGEQGDGEPGKGRWGAVIDPGSGDPAGADADPAAAEQAQAQAEDDVRQAAQEALQRGTAPGWLAELVARLSEPRVPWRRVLWRFVQSARTDERSWARPDRRHVHRGLYLPGPAGTALRPGVVLVDTSGSTMPYREAFLAELGGIHKLLREDMRVLVHSTGVDARVMVGPLDDFASTVKPVLGGSGGTSHRPVFDELARGPAPAWVVALTDMESCFPPRPSYPVLWCVPAECRAAGPGWGQRVEVRR